MKKSAKIWSIILSLVMCISVFSLAACEPAEKPDDKDPPAHTHTFAAEWSKDATNHWHAATCDHKTEVKDKAAHNTTGEGGACSVCGYKEEVAHEHTFAQESWTISDTQHWRAATCEHTDEKGSVENHDTKGENGTCSVCGYIPHEHQYKYYYYADTHWQKVNCKDAKLAANCKGENVDAPKYINLEKHTFNEDGSCSVCGYSGKYLQPKDNNCILDSCGGCIRMQCPNEKNDGHVYCADKHGADAKKYDLEAEDAVLTATDGNPSIYDNRQGKRNCAHASYCNVSYTFNVSKATTATLKIRCGRKGSLELFTKYMNIFVNGADDEFETAALFAQPNSEDSKCNNDWLVLGCVTLVAGENTIEIFGEEGGIHIDKIELVTASDVNITWEKVDNSAITDVRIDDYPVIEKYKNKL